MSHLEVIILVMCFVLVSCFANNMVCRPVEDACADDMRQHLHGPPGKLGPRGEKGNKGETGLPGVKVYDGLVNQSIIQETIKQEVESATRELTQRLESTESKLGDVSAVLGILLEEKSACKMKYEGTCYRALVHPKYDVKYSNALSFCRMHDMEPAEIPSESHYYKLMECVRAEIPSETSFADIFTGMTYNQSARSVTLSDGTSAPFVKWYPNYPSNESGRVAMGIVVLSDVSHQGHGMYNVHPGTLQGIVCQKKNC
uniref:uncharacterized protein LOC120334084 n=1 Tax=Styela clava TaxID=7725 RepID=UPI0019394898|nr:uncharacterized protein LOC120334084 [Styela clava]